MIKIAILGFGVVGSGVYELIKQNMSHIAEKSTRNIQVKYIVDIRDIEGEEYAGKAVKDFSAVENDPEVRVVIETIGGAGVAYDYTKRALSAGKHVVTSNKELVAQHGFELLQLAEQNNVNYMFEASVGGGIPIIRPMIQCLSANRIYEIYGILNGTTNYILTSMIKDGVTLEQALSEAKRLGYAEQNPAADIEGLDAGRKICILSSLALGHHILPEQIKAEGIMGITLDDVRYADAAGMAVKLLGRFVRTEDGGACVYVAPHLISRSLLLSGVDDVFNGIVVKGDAVDEVMFYGRGAGAMPTASAVVADVIDAVRHIDKTKNTGLWDAGGDYIRDTRSLSQRFYVRSEGQGSPVGEIFGDIAEIPGGAGNAFITPAMSGFEFEEKLERYKRSAVVYSQLRVIE